MSSACDEVIQILLLVASCFLRRNVTLLALMVEVDAIKLRYLLIRVFRFPFLGAIVTYRGGAG